MKKVIIIGAGLGGLVAGNLLVKKGHKVTIFESHSMPGGYTAGFHRKGYYFESGTLSFEASPSVFKAMQDIGVYDQVEFVPQKIRTISEAFSGAPDSFDDFKKMIYNQNPSQKEALDRYFSDIDRINDALGASSSSPMPYMYSGISFIKALLPYIASGQKALKVFKEYGSITLSEFTQRYFEKDSPLFRLLNSYGYPDMAAAFIGGAFSGIFSDYWTVKGGMQSWADTLADHFMSLGGELKLRSYVDKILTRDGRAAGVSCSGHEYSADYVISASDYKKTLLKLLDNQMLVPDELKGKVEKAPVSEGMFTVYLGLAMSKEELAKHMVVPHVFFNDELPGYDIYNSGDEDFFRKAPISFYSPSMVNPDHAPEGKSSLMIQAVVPYQWMNNWGGGSREEYKRLKEAAMECVIEKAAKVIPSLRDSIEFKEAATPLTYERYTHNTDGATSAWSWNPKKMFFKDSMGVNVNTPVKNLYIGSCWAMEIGGVPGAIAGAYQSAKKIK